MVSLQIEIFLLLLTGYIMGKKGMMNKSTRDQLTDMVVYIILPCSILKSFQMELSKEILMATAQVLAAAFAIQALYWVLNKVLYLGFSQEEQIACKYSTMVTNASFIGLPVAESLYGSSGLLYASVFVLPQRIFMWAYGLPMYTQIDRRNIIKKVLTHPCVVSIFLGFALMVLYGRGLHLPAALDRTIGALGTCSTALCLVVIGSILSDLEPKEMFSLWAVVFSLYRLLLIPLIIMALLKLTPLDDLSRHVCVLLSAMPAPTTTVILAQKYNRGPEFASKLMVASTLLSLMTIPVVTALMNP